MTSTQHENSPPHVERQEGRADHHADAAGLGEQAPSTPVPSLKGKSKLRAAATGNYSMDMLSKRKQEWAPLGAVSNEYDGNPEVEKWLVSEQFQQLKAEQVLPFDTCKFPLQDSVVSMIGSVEPRLLERPLSELHYALDPNFSPEKSFKHAKKHINGQLYCGAAGSALRRNFEKFVCEFIAPHVQGILSCDRLVFQAAPCLRMQPPSHKRIGRPHCDSMYYHQRGQLNFWVPLTRVYSSNTLWAESEPGKEDFRPFELDYGQVVRFYGNKCTHFTVPNTTPDTRVSLDMRVVPGPCYDPDPPESRGRDGRPLFSIGGYYAEAVRDASSDTWSVVPGTVTHSHAVLD